MTSTVEKFILNSTDFGFVIKDGKLNDTHNLLSINNDEKNFTFNVILYPKIQLLEVTTLFIQKNTNEIRKESIEIQTNSTNKLIVITFQQVNLIDYKTVITVYVDCLTRGTFNLPLNISTLLSTGQVSIVSCKKTNLTFQLLKNCTFRFFVLFSFIHKVASSSFLFYFSLTQFTCKL